MQMGTDMTSQTAARYFIFSRAGRAIVSIERDTNDMDRACTVRDLIAGQVDKPLSVWCAEDNRFYDASDEIAQAIADEASSKGLELTRSILEFISEHVGLRSAYALGLEAA
jgi:hypothetical protein